MGKDIDPQHVVANVNYPKLIFSEYFRDNNQGGDTITLM